MIKVYEISQIEKTGVGDGTVKAATGGTKNFFLGTVTDGVVASAPTTGLGIKLIANYGRGDDIYKDFVTPAGELVTAWDVSVWRGKYLQVSPDSITYGSLETYASITAGTTLMNAGTDGNLHIMASDADISDGGVYFKVTKKINFDGDGVLVEVIVK
jgi:hypothetical protein